MLFRSEVVVQSIKRENTELSAINAVRSSAVVMSAVSSNEMSKTPDKNAAEVVKRVPGISILDDRYIVIRGLPQRYNNVWLNNSSVPSSDPDTRSFSFDMIPTSQIENILIVKSPGGNVHGGTIQSLYSLFTKQFTVLMFIPHCCIHSGTVKDFGIKCHLRLVDLRVSTRTGEAGVCV